MNRLPVIPHKLSRLLAPGRQFVLRLTPVMVLVASLLFTWQMSALDRGGIFWAAGLLASLLLAGLVWLLIHGRYRSLELAAEMYAELTASEERFREIMQFSPIGMAVVAPDGQFLEVNRALCELLGYERHELTTLTFQQITHPQDLEKDLAMLRLLQAGEQETFRMEKRYLDRAGESVWVQLTVSMVADEQGRPLYFIGQVEDIRQRKQFEQRLKAESQRNALLFEQARDGIHVIDEDGRLQQCNQAFCDMLGYAREELLGKHISFWDQGFIGVDFRGKLTNLPAEGLQLEACHWRKDGTAFEVEISIIAIELDGCRLIYAASRDISQRKQAEESTRLLASVFEASSEAVTITDADNNILAVNPAFTLITGYTFDEVRGKDPNVQSSGWQDEQFYQEMWAALESRGHWQGEIWNRRKSGELFAEWLTINTLYNPDGSVHRRVALFSDITRKKETEGLIWKQANFDALTDLPNRRMFLDRLVQEVKKAHRADKRLALLFIDLDRFKEVNDTLGHRAGDQLLVEAARRISGCVRESDTVARLGGDEFTVIVSDLSERTHVEGVVQHLLAKLTEPFKLGDELAHISASIGITLFPADAGDAEALLRNADQAMYVAKNLGRNRYSYFTPALQEAAQQRLHLTAELHVALERQQFRVYFQPIVRLADGHVTKAEALVRWQHPQRGLVGPLDFIPLAEETGLINPLGDWVLRESMAWLKRWESLTPEGIQISVNKSPVQFLAEVDSCPDWMAEMEQHAVRGDRLVVEITEGVLLDADDRVRSRLACMREAGIRFAIDDFGTGYSSLSYLKKFDLDFLKIDRSFVSDLENSPDDLALCEAIVVMAHKLGLQVIAEGIETERQMAMLRDIGCDFGQGYWFSRPIPPQEFEALWSA
jgi:diguanylate cyclase (GGDEF)-like protein/PAS domain S-box-containing protein